MRAGRHPPEQVALVVHDVVAFGLRTDEAGAERRVPEDLLGDVALVERRQRLVEVVAGGSRRRILAQPLVPLGDGIDGCRAVGLAAAAGLGADGVAGARLHADAPLVDRDAVRLALGADARHRQPGVRHSPAEVGGALAVVHVAVDADAVDLLDVVGEEVGDVLVGRPVDRHAEVVAVLLLEAGLEVGVVEPVLAEPVEVHELLVGQLVEIAVRTGGEAPAHEVVEVERRRGHVLPVAGHLLRKVVGLLHPAVGADQVAVVDVAVIEVAVGLHLGLHRLHHLALAEDLVVDLDAGDFLEGLGQDLELVGVRRDALRQHVDLHAGERRSGVDEPLHLGLLLVDAEHRRLELVVDPLFGCGHVGEGRRRARHERDQGGSRQSEACACLSSQEPACRWAGITRAQFI